MAVSAQQKIIRITLLQLQAGFLISRSALNPSSTSAAKTPEAMLRQARINPAAPVHHDAEKVGCNPRPQMASNEKIMRK